MFKMIIFALSLISFFNSQSSDSNAAKNATKVDENEKNSKEQEDKKPKTLYFRGWDNTNRMAYVFKGNGYWRSGYYIKICKNKRLWDGIGLGYSLISEEPITIEKYLLIDEDKYLIFVINNEQQIYYIIYEFDYFQKIIKLPANYGNQIIDAKKNEIIDAKKVEDKDQIEITTNKGTFKFNIADGSEVK